MREPSAQSGDGLWAGLRRRKVVQWGIAYVAAAWGPLQGLAYLSTVFQWPARLQRPATTAFLVGRAHAGCASSDDDGISEELLNVMVRVDGLGVASRTSSFS